MESDQTAKPERHGTPAVEENNAAMNENAEATQDDANSENNNSDDSDNDDWEPYSWETFAQLPVILDRAFTERAFAWSSSQQSIPNPGLQIDGIGTIGIPISTREIELLKGHSINLLNQRGEVGVHDAPKRNVWDFFHSAFSIQNSRFNTTISTILGTVKAKLGLRCEGMTATLRKLAIHGESGQFEPFQSLDMQKGEFGTLIVVLPTYHEGGDINFKHKRQDYLYDSASTSSFDISYAAWFADVNVEAQPISRGYRIMLTYVLKQSLADGQQVQLAPQFNYRREIRHMLRDYEVQNASGDPTDFPDYTLLRLDQPYTKNGIRLDDLGEKEQYQVRLLADVCENLGFAVYLAGREKYERVDKYSEDEIEGSDGFTSMTQLDGTPIDFYAEYDEKNYLYGSYNEDEPPDEEEVEDSGYRYSYGHDNEDCIDRYWHETVLVLVPLHRWVDFHIAYHDPFRVATALLDDILEQAKTSYEARQKLTDLSRRISSHLSWSKERKTQITVPEQKICEKIISACVEHKWFMILSKFPVDLQVREVRALGERIGLYGIDEWSGFLGGLVLWNSATEVKFELLSNLATVIASVKMNPPQYSAIWEWFKKQVTVAVESFEVKTREDARVLAQILSRWNWPFRFDARQYLSTKLANANNLTIAAFIVGLSNNYIRDSESDLEADIKALVVEFWSEFSYAVRPIPDIAPEQHFSAQLLDDLISVSSELVEAISCEEAINQLQKALPGVNRDYIQGTLLEFINTLVGPGTFCPMTRTIPANMTAISRYIITVLNRYVEEFVGESPVSQPNWTVPVTRGCGRCVDCLRITNFLADSNRRDLSFTSHVQNMKHLQEAFRNNAWIRVERGPGKPPFWTWRKLDSPQQKSFRTWETKRDAVRKKLSQIDGPQKKLQPYLGSQYDRIMSAQKEPPANSQSSARNPLAPTRPASLNSTANNVAGSNEQIRKRLGSPIDLTDEGSQKRRKTEGSDDVDVVDLT